MDLLISLHSWLYAISPVHQSVERLHINYLAVTFAEPTGDVLRLNSAFSTAHPAPHSLCLL